MKNVQGSQPTALRWHAVSKDLDQMPDKESDGETLPVDGNMIPKEGKYKKGPMKMTMEQAYVQDKDYMEWIRGHIKTTSGREMQRFKLYVLTRDEKKKHRLILELGLPQEPKPKAAAKPKACSARVTRPLEEDQTGMEWQYVTNQTGRLLTILVSVNGNPVMNVDPFHPVGDDHRVIMMEMHNLLSLTLFPDKTD